MGFGEYMNKILKYIIVFIIFFVLSLPVSYLGVFFVKQKMFEHEVEASKAWLDTEIPDAERRLQQSYDEIDKSHDLDVNSGGQMREYGRKKISAAYCYYIWEYEKFVTSLPRKNYLYLGLDFYSQRGLLVCLRFISLNPSWKSSERFMFDSEKDYMNMLQGYVKIWKAESGNTSKDWWDDFGESEFYDAFLNDVFTEMEKDGNVTLEEAYRGTTSGSVELEGGLNIYIANMYLVPLYKRISETAHRRYIEDKEKGDFFSASFDSKMVFETWQYFQWLDGFQWFDNEFLDGMFILEALRSRRITNIDYDIILIVDFAVVISLLLLILWERIFMKPVK